MDSPRIVVAIRSMIIRGKGTEEDRVREVVQYWSLDGKDLLAEMDPCCPNHSRYN